MKHTEFIAQVNELITESLVDAKNDYNNASSVAGKISIKIKAKEKLHSDVDAIKRKYIIAESIDEKESQRISGILYSMMHRHNSDIEYMEY